MRQMRPVPFVSNGRKSMIMPRKTRRMVILASVVVLLSIIAIVLLLLYKNTDLLKSSSTLFTKYMGQNLENMEAIYDRVGTNEYNTLLRQNKYVTETQIRVNHTANIGTSSENTQNSINQLKFKISGQTDNTNQFKYQNIKLLKEDEKIAEVEMIQNGITQGIRFSDLFNQYILADNENLKELFEKIGYSEQQLQNIPDRIEFNHNWKEIFQFLKEEKQNLTTKYMSMLNSNVSKDNFSKQKNQTIEMNGKSIKVNSYSVTLTKEQLNNIYIKMLEEVKQEEIFLAKIDSLQTIIESYGFNGTIDLRQQFVDNIESQITEITKNNIGKEEAKIIVYESDQTTIRNFIQHPDYEIKIDELPSQTDDFIEISFQDSISGKQQVFTYKRTNEDTNLIFTDKKEEKTTQYSFILNQKVEGNHCEKNIVAKYEDNSNRVEMIMEQQIDMVNSFEDEVVLKEDNSINLSELESEQVRSVLEQVNRSVTEKINEITTTAVITEDLFSIAKDIGIVKEQQTIEAMGITETEKNRFNSKFEILQGEELDSNAILNLINAIQDNLVDLEIVSNTQLRLKLDKLNKNEQSTSTLTSFIEGNTNKKYNAKVEYDEETGLVSDILLTMLEK